MCDSCAMTPSNVLTKQDFAPEVEQSFRWFLDNYRDALGPVEADIESFLDAASDGDLSSLDTLRSEISSRVGNYTSDFEAVFREGGERAAAAGRAITGRRFELDVAFDIVPDRTLEVIDEWVDTAAGSTLETITEDSARWLRGAHEEGLSIDDIADQINEELFAGRLEDHVAERAARTGTISTSNAGTHSAFEDADSVVGEEWLTEIDGRQRDSHEEANGQIVAVGTPFEVGGVLLDHPGDPTGPIEEIVQCRCTIVPVFADELDEDELEALQDGDRLKFAGGDLQKITADGELEPIAA